MSRDHAEPNETLVLIAIAVLVALAWGAWLYVNDPAGVEFPPPTATTTEP